MAVRSKATPDAPDAHEGPAVEYVEADGRTALRRIAGAPAGRRIASLVVLSEPAEGQDPVDRLIEDVELAERVGTVARRLHSSTSETVEALERLALPAGVDEPTVTLTEADEDALRAAGSLGLEMPNLEARASFRTARKAQELMSRALSVREAADVLNVSTSRVRQRLSDRKLLGVQNSASWRLPRFQFPDGRELPGLADLIAAFPLDVHPLSVQTFLTAPMTDLDVDGVAMSPADWLQSGGDVGEVISLIRAAYETP